MGVELIIIVAGRVGVMEGSGLFHIHLHLVQKQIVFVPLYFSIDHYLSFVSVPLPNGPRGCENVGLVGESTVEWYYWEDLCLSIHSQFEISPSSPTQGLLSHLSF